MGGGTLELPRCRLYTLPDRARTVLVVADVLLLLDLVFVLLHSIYVKYSVLQVFDSRPQISAKTIDMYFISRKLVSVVALKPLF